MTPHLPSALCPPPTADCALPAADCPLLSAHCEFISWLLALAGHLCGGDRL